MELDPSNCIGIKDYAEIYGCADLAKAAEKFIFRHFLEVSESEEFEILNQERLIDLITHDLNSSPIDELGNWCLKS